MFVVTPAHCVGRSPKSICSVCFLKKDNIGSRHRRGFALHIGGQGLWLKSHRAGAESLLKALWQQFRGWTCRAGAAAVPCVLLGLCAQLGQLSTAAFVVEVQKERGAGLPCWQFGKSWESVVFFCLAAVESEPKIPSFFSLLLDFESTSCDPPCYYWYGSCEILISLG